MINTDKTKMKGWKYIAIAPVFAIGLFLLGCEDQVMTEAVEIAKKSTTVTEYPKAVKDAVTSLQKAHPERKFLVVEPDERVEVARYRILQSSLANKSTIQSLTVLKDIKDDDGRLRSFLIIVYDENAKK